MLYELIGTSKYNYIHKITRQCHSAISFIDTLSLYYKLLDGMSVSLTMGLSCIHTESLMSFIMVRS